MLYIVLISVVTSILFYLNVYYMTSAATTLDLETRSVIYMAFTAHNFTPALPATTVRDGRRRMYALSPCVLVHPARECQKEWRPHYAVK